MSRTIELPDAVYAALQKAAQANGATAAEWIAAHLPAMSPPDGNSLAAKPDWLDRDFLKTYAPETADAVSLEDVRGTLAKIPGRLADDIRAQRDER